MLKHNITRWKLAQSPETRINFMLRSIYWRWFVAILMALSAMVAVRALMVPGVSMTSEVRTLNCQFQLHQHEEACYDTEGNLSCGYASYAVHTHETNCYDENGTLVCTLPEVEAHTHTDDCYRQVVICGQEEGESHTHTDDCYESRLLCGKNQVILHHHDSECYDKDGALICGQTQVLRHQHTDLSCFQSDTQAAKESTQSTSTPSTQAAETPAQTESTAPETESQETEEPEASDALPLETETAEETEDSILNVTSSRTGLRLRAASDTLNPPYARIANTEEGNNYTFTVNAERGSSNGEQFAWAASDEEKNYYALYTGQSASIKMSAEVTAGGVTDTLRIYFKFSSSENNAYNSTTKKLFNYPLNVEQSLTNNGVTFSATFQKVEDEDNLYYVELGSLEAGRTSSFEVSVMYPTYSAGGSVTCWLSATSTDGTESKSEEMTVNWITRTNDFTLTNAPSSTALTLTGDGSENSLLYLSNLAFTVNMSKVAKETGYDSYGQNPMKYALYSDTITMPQGFAWRDGVIEAIRNGDWTVSSSWSSGKKTFNVTLYKGTANETTVTLATFTAESTSASYTSRYTNLALSLDENDNVVISWRYNHASSSDPTAEITPYSATITYGSQVICADGDALQGKLSTSGTTNSTGSKSYNDYFTNNVTCAQHFFFADENGAEVIKTVSDSSGKKLITICEAGYTFKKVMSNTYPYMGTSETFTISLSNSTQFTYTFGDDNYKINDSLPDWYYIKPADLETMLTNTENGKKLTITISNGQSRDSSWNYMYNTYNGLSSSDNSACKDQLVDITLGWENDVLTLTWAKKDTATSTTSTSSGTYTIGAGGDYASVDLALSALNFNVLYSTQYTCTWDISPLSLYSGMTKEWKILSTVKNAFMRLTADQRNSYPFKNNSSYDCAPNSAAITYLKDGNTETFAQTGNYTSLTNSSAATNYPRIYRDLTLNKYAYKDGTAIQNTDGDTVALSAGSVVKFKNQVQNNSSASYQGLKLTDKLSGGFVLLVKKDDNTQLSTLGLTEYYETESGAWYYVLSKAGTYEDVKVGGGDYLATVVVSEAQGQNGYQTMLYWNIDVGSTTTKSLTYYTKIEFSKSSPEESGEKEGLYALNDEVWLGDHQSHRLYDTFGRYGSAISTEKKIVSSADPDADNLLETLDPSADTLTDFSLVGEADKVLYRIAVTALGEEGSAITISGAKMSDTLPAGVNNTWSKDNVSISYVCAEGATATISDASSDAWSITTQSNSTATTTTTQSIKWNDDFSIQFTGTLYIYVQLTFPEGDDWVQYTKNYGSTEIKNTWKLYNMQDTVTHLLECDAEAVLQKGVYSTGTTTTATATSSSKTYSMTTDVNSRLNYSNNTGSYGIVNYYITLYNSGYSRLYLTEIQDVLPKGFTFAGLAQATSSTSSSSNFFGKRIGSSTTNYYNRYYNSSATNQNYIKIVNATTNETVTPTYRYGYISAATKSSDGQQTVTFTFPYSSSYSTSNVNLSYDSREGKYYLNPGEVFTIMYYCYTNDYEDTADTVTNSAFMPFYNYNRSDIQLAENYTITPKDTSYTANDGTQELLTGADAYSYGASYQNTNWLSSSVNSSRGSIKPGIQKKASEDILLATETATWNITSYNDGADAMRGYIITDVMMAPYTFTGKVGYTIYNSAGKSVSTTTNLFSISSLPAVGSGEKQVCDSTSTFGAVFARIDEDEDGNQVLTIRFEDKLKAAIPSGGYSVLSLGTENETTTKEAKTYINQAYLTPINQTFSQSDVSQGEAVEFTYWTKNKETDVAEQQTGLSVYSQAQITATIGYGTTSYKAVTALSDTLAATTNSAKSTDGTNYILLPDADTVFRYDLVVSNSGGKSTPSSMSLFVLVDNLPEIGDHTTFYRAYARSSEFRVDFYGTTAEELNLTIKTTDKNGNALKTFDTSEYEVLFSTQTEFDYEENELLWQGNTLTEADGWYTLDQCLAAGNLNKMRSFRIVIKDDGGAKSYIPANSTITISFNAKVCKNEEGAANFHAAGYSERAWNSFAYYYIAGSNTLRSSPEKVGVKMPGVPFLQKELAHVDDTTYAAEENETYTFLLYTGSSLNLDSSSSVEELASQLSAENRTFTVVDRSVAAGQSESESWSSTINGMPLDDMKVYTYDADTKAVTAGTEAWTWTEGTTYTLMEVLSENSNYVLKSLGESGGKNDSGSYTFTFSKSSSPEYVAVNTRRSWSIQLTKVDGDDESILLPGAVFDLYLMTPVEDQTTLEESVQTKAVTNEDGTETTYRLDLVSQQTTSEEPASYGKATWSLLKGDLYYLVEVTPPNGYDLDEDNGQIIKAPDDYLGTTKITVTNQSSFILPNSGGMGTPLFYETAFLMLTTGAVLTVKKRRARKTIH